MEAVSKMTRRSLAAEGGIRPNQAIPDARSRSHVLALIPPSRQARVARSNFQLLVL